MNKTQLETLINFLIQRIFSKQTIFSNASDEKQYWDNYWDKEIAYFHKYGKSRETRDKWLNRCNIKLLEHYKELAGNLSGKFIVECGGGSGITSLLMARQGAIVTIVDYSQKSLKYSKLIANQLGIHKSVELKEADIYKYKPEHQLFDIAWNCGVVEHYPWIEAIAMIKQMKKMIRPNGKVLVTLPNLLSFEILYRMIKEGKGSEIYYSQRQLKKLMCEAGLRNVRVTPFCFATPSFAPSFGRCLENKIIVKLIPSTSWLFSAIGTK